MAHPRAAAAQAAVDDAQAALDAAVAQRRVVVAELRAEGWSLGRIAEALGVSKSRVAQIVTPPPPSAGAR